MDGASNITDTPARLGADLRALRRAKSLTLTELALKIGRSVGWLSQAERGLSEPSLDDLRRIANALEVPISLFFVNDDAPEAERGHVVRSEARRSLGNPEAGAVEQLLSPDLGGQFQMIRTIFPAHQQMMTPQRRATEESGYVISGVLDLWIGDLHFELHPGDSFRFKDEAYRWQNQHDAEAVVVWAIAPPVY